MILGRNKNATTNNPLGYHQKSIPCIYSRWAWSMTLLDSFLLYLIHQASTPFSCIFLRIYSCVHRMVPSLPPLSVGHPRNWYGIILFAHPASWCLIDHVGSPSLMLEEWTYLPMPFSSMYHCLHICVHYQAMSLSPHEGHVRLHLWELHQIYHS